MNKKRIGCCLEALLPILAIVLVLEHFSGSLTPIFFYGKVVDEKGNPIQRADVSISVNKLMTGYTYHKTTDNHGQFSVTWKFGSGLGITVAKDGYYQLPQSEGVYGYAPWISDSAGPKRGRPTIFVLRKKGPGVALLLKNVSSPLPRDGTPVDIDLETGKIVAPGTGNFRIEYWSNSRQEDANAPYDWRCRITIPEGGLVPRIDDLDFMAPIDGYQPSEEISCTAGQRPYLRDLDKEYFVKLRDGKYARITVRIPAVNVLSYINPTPGDRNLESNSN